MKIICVNCLSIFLLVNFSLNSVYSLDNSTLWPLIDKLNYQEYSTVLPRPVESTKPSTELLNKTLNLLDSNRSAINQPNLKDEIIDTLKAVNQPSIDSNNLNFTERTRTSKLLSNSILFGSKLRKIKRRKPVDRNQTISNADLNSNTLVVSGRASFDDFLKPKSKSGDSFLNDKNLAHLPAYDKIKFQNDKFSYDNFFELYDKLPHFFEDGHDEDVVDIKSHSSKNKQHEEENQSIDPFPYEHLVQYRPANILPLAAKEIPKQDSYSEPQNYHQQNYWHDEYQIPQISHAEFHNPSITTIQKFKKYQRQRLKELFNRPVSQAFQGKFKPDYVPKYMLEAPQRSHQQTGLGELFIVLGPLVILPLLSSFALSTFTTLYVTKSLIKPSGSTASTTARHKQFNVNSKLLNEEKLNQTFFNFNLASPNESLLYHPFNASEFDSGLIKSKTSKRIDEEAANQKDFQKLDDNKTGFKNLEKESLKILKRSKRHLGNDLIIKELGLNEKQMLNEKVAIDENKRTLRSIWNEVLWTRPKQTGQTPWLPLTKKLARQPRNSLHSKLYIVRPTKKAYKNLSRNSNLAMRSKNQFNNTINLSNHNFNQPENFLSFAMNDAIASAKKLVENFESDKNLDFLHQSAAASSPSPTYSNFTTSIKPNIFETNYQPKIYNLRTLNNSLTRNNLQLIKRNSNLSAFQNLNSNQPIYGPASSSNNFSINDKNDIIFQRIAKVNPFNTPSFLADKKPGIVSNVTMSNNQARFRNSRRLDLNDDFKKEKWDKDVFDTMPLDEHNFTNKNYLKQQENQEVSALNSDLDVVQKYLKQTRPDGEYNDEIIATYLTCNGLLSQNNQCLQRLVCQYVDPNVKMPELEKEVASLIIYAILKNKYIDEEVKNGLKKAAQDAYQKKTGQCTQYKCLRTKPPRK